MAQDLYADQVANIREKLARLEGEREQSFDDMATNITDQYNDKMKDFEAKWKAVLDAGEGEVGALASAKSIVAGGQKLRDLYKGRQERKTAERQRRQDEQQEDVGEDDDFDDDVPELDTGTADDSVKDFQTDDGRTYFRGTEADHEEFYKDDGSGELKDPSQIPDGHQDVSGDDEDEGQEDEEEEPPQPSAEQPVAEQPPAQGASMDGEGASENPFSFESFTRDPRPVQDVPSFQELGIPTESTTTRTFTTVRPTADQLREDPFGIQEPRGARPVYSSRTTVSRPTQQFPDQPADQTNSSVRPQLDEPSPSVVGGEQDAVRTGLQTGEEGGQSFLERTGQRAFQSLAQKGQKIKQGFQAVKDFFSPSGGAEGAGTAGAEGAGPAGAEAGTAGAEAGADLAGLGASDAVLGAIPVVGELALAVSGFVAIGE